MSSPQVFTEAADMRKFSREQRRQGKTIGFVPTMVGVNCNGQGAASLHLPAERSLQRSLRALRCRAICTKGMSLCYTLQGA